MSSQRQNTYAAKGLLFLSTTEACFGLSLSQSIATIVRGDGARVCRMVKSLDAYFEECRWVSVERVHETVEIVPHLRKLVPST